MSSTWLQDLVTTLRKQSFCLYSEGLQHLNNISHIQCKAIQHGCILQYCADPPSMKQFNQGGMILSTAVTEFTADTSLVLMSAGWNSETGQILQGKEGWQGQCRQRGMWAAIVLLHDLLVCLTSNCSDPAAIARPDANSFMAPCRQLCGWM